MPSLVAVYESGLDTESLEDESFVTEISDSTSYNTIPENEPQQSESIKEFPVCCNMTNDLKLVVMMSVNHYLV